MLCGRGVTTSSRAGNFCLGRCVARAMRIRWVRTAAFAAMASLFWAGLGGRGQGTADGTAKPQWMARDAGPDWEVVTVKPSDPNAVGDHIDQNGRHLVLAGDTVEMLLVLGYNVQKNQIADAPDWVKTARWNIEGLCNTDGEMNLPQLQTMIRKVLAERFGLKLHKDQREMAVYRLTVTKGGPKMTAGDPNGSPEQHPRDGSGQHSETMKNASMAELALVLEFRVDRPIVDQTGLNGRYDFTLKWTYDEDRAPTDGSAAPSLFTAVQEQLGLKLEPVKAPADVLVIDQVERPGEN